MSFDFLCLAGECSCRTVWWDHFTARKEAFRRTGKVTGWCPSPATLAKWTYRGIYRADDKQVGLWSQPVSVTVGG